MSRWQLLDQVNVGGVKYYVRQVAGNPKDQTARVRIKHQYALAVLVGVMLVWLLIFGAMNMSHLVRTPIYGLIIVLTVGFSVLTSPGSSLSSVPPKRVLLRSFFRRMTWVDLRKLSTK